MKYQLAEKSHYLLKHAMYELTYEKLGGWNWRNDYQGHFRRAFQFWIGRDCAG